MKFVSFRNFYKLFLERSEWTSKSDDKLEEWKNIYIVWNSKRPTDRKCLINELINEPTS